MGIKKGSPLGWLCLTDLSQHKTRKLYTHRQREREREKREHMGLFSIRVEIPRKGKSGGRLRKAEARIFLIRSRTLSRLYYQHHHHNHCGAYTYSPFLLIKSGRHLLYSGPSSLSYFRSKLQRRSRARSSDEKRSSRHSFFSSSPPPPPLESTERGGGLERARRPLCTECCRRLRHKHKVVREYKEEKKKRAKEQARERDGIVVVERFVTYRFLALYDHGAKLPGSSFIIKRLIALLHLHYTSRSM